MAPGYVFQVSLRVTVQNQIRIAQRIIVDEVIQFRPLCHSHIQRNRGILLSEETKNPNPSPIEKRFGFSLFGAMEGTRTPGLLIRSARRAIPSIFGSYVLTLFLCDVSQVLNFEFLHPLSDFATICTLCTF